MFTIWGAFVPVVDSVAVLEAARQKKKDVKNDVKTKKTSWKRSTASKTRPKKAITYGSETANERQTSEASIADESQAEQYG